MGKIKDYCVVTGVGPWQLEEVVRARLAEGWEPIGAAQMFKEYDKTELAADNGVKGGGQ